MWASASVLVWTALVASSGGVKLLTGGLDHISIVDPKAGTVEEVVHEPDILDWGVLDYHMEKGYILYYNIEGQIKRVNTKENAGATKVIAISSVNNYIGGLVVDWINNYVYWLNRLHWRVEMVDLDGNGRTIAFNGTDFWRVGARSGIADLAIDPHQGFLFIGFYYGYIIRSNLKNRELKKVDLLEDQLFLEMVLSVDMNRLYVLVDLVDSQVLYSCDYDGQDVKRIEIGSGPFQRMIVFQNNFYFTKEEYMRGRSRRPISRVYTATFKTNSSTDLQYMPMDRTLDLVRDLRVFDPQAQLSAAQYAARNTAHSPAGSSGVRPSVAVQTACLL